ncbi:hypothetical protein HanIR_Chr11g0543501 [Helianthus annuus]|nr:hypothetical protein HanIR_Chr11g0543501 [Helianthus annuus]
MIHKHIYLLFIFTRTREKARAMHDMHNSYCLFVIRRFTVLDKLTCEMTTNLSSALFNYISKQSFPCVSITIRLETSIASLS